MSKRFFWLLTIATFLFSCQSRRTYYQYQAVDDRCWSATDTLYFVPDTFTQDGLYTLKAGIRFNEHYPYRDLWLVIEQRTTKPVVSARRDTLHLVLANNEGRWLTNGVVLHEAEETVATSRLNMDDAYEFLVYHIMRDQNLTGVTEVGLKIY
ncbi:MAG: gliding motility lipoprotein GldH [Bacteroidales bacterium]|nr:gliding motility lipoprotein GldH [Bacteroidales bacterium]